MGVLLLWCLCCFWSHKTHRGTKRSKGRRCKESANYICACKFFAFTQFFTFLRIGKIAEKSSVVREHSRRTVKWIFAQTSRTEQQGQKLICAKVRKTEKWKNIFKNLIKNSSLSRIDCKWVLTLKKLEKNQLNNCSKRESWSTMGMDNKSDLHAASFALLKIWRIPIRWSFQLTVIDIFDIRHV